MLANISCKVTDGNPAPATSLQFNIPGLGLSQDFDFNLAQIPLKNKAFSPVFSIPLVEVFTGNYEIEVLASNEISETASVYTKSFYLDGKSFVCTGIHVHCMHTCKMCPVA